MCGEHKGTQAILADGEGSSPRVRGTLLVLLVLPVHHGIIPACAGNTSCPPEPACRPRDHPRVCGEHFTLISMLLLSSGSSPRVRGTPSGFFKVRSDLGIIPACAGNTSTRLALSRGSRDHPRVCGEHAEAANAEYVWEGSSPRVRGTLHEARRDVGLDGIIPACAGNTSRQTRERASSRDHPRVCGEHAAARSSTSAMSGSSPRVRGTLSLEVRDGPDLGIIPACAGNTSHIHAKRSPRRDHPRVCGEHCTYTDTAGSVKGSSPRVRGTLGDHRVDRAHRGIIPACAGNTTGR